MKFVKPASISEKELLNLINNLNDNDNEDDFLVQLPLPEYRKYRVHERRNCSAVSPDEDVDGFHVINVRKMYMDLYSILLPHEMKFHLPMKCPISLPHGLSEK